MPWLPDSNCDHGLISLPFLDGPALENASILGQSVRILWLIPITRAEREYKVQHGVELAIGVRKSGAEIVCDVERFNSAKPNSLAELAANNIRPEEP